MMKEPKPGRVKTRLAADIGVVDATWWFRHQCARLLRQVGKDPRWQTWLAVAPDGAMSSPMLPGHVPRISQGRGDLGERMRRVFSKLPAGEALIVGADIPGLDAGAVWQGFNALKGADAVFGPATDGGYWMVGLSGARRMETGALRDVRWSTASALQDSIESLGPDMRVGIAGCLRDVDTGQDLADTRRDARRNSDQLA